MTTTLGEFTNVRERALELGLEPVGKIALLPRGFESGGVSDFLVYDVETATLRKLLAESGIEAQQPYPVDGAGAVYVEKYADWIAPLVFIGSQILLGNPQTVSLLLSVIEHFAVRVTRGRQHPNVKLSFVLEVEEGRTYKRLSYEGPPKSIKDIETVIKGISDEQDSR